MVNLFPLLAVNDNCLLCMGTNAHYICVYDYRPIICTFEFACSASHWQLPTEVVTGQCIHPAFYNHHSNE